MKAGEAKLLDFIKRSNQFAIPIYQRMYSWTEKECLQLWKDIVRTGLNDSLSAHFVGSIVYIQSGQYQVVQNPPLLVIDGQQRLTTVTLLLIALAESVGTTEPVDGFSQRKIKHYYLLNTEEEGDRRYKLILSQTDKDTLISLVSDRPKPTAFSVRVQKNYELFSKLIKENKEKLPVLCKGIGKLMVVDVSLTREQDNPQLIFESMNSTGKELSQADLIRNFVLMGLDPVLQTQLYEDYWRPMELDFGQESYGTHFDSFMRDYLTVVTGEIPNISAVYDAFKAHSQVVATRTTGTSGTMAELCKEIRRFAGFYCNIVLKKETDTELRLAFQDIKELRVEVSYPFILELYGDYDTGHLGKEDFLESVRLIESYVFRRAVCNVPTNSLNKTFATFSRSLKKDRYLESVKAHFLKLPSYRRFPTDTEFERDVQIRDLYNFRSRSYWLRRLENFGRKERVVVDDYTIEHIMPQNENLSGEWKSDLGDNWEAIHETWLHCLGNLTLTAYNSEYSDHPFKVKRDMPDSPDKALRQSPLKLNQGFGSLEIWNEAAIQHRGEMLSKQVLKVWGSPKLPPDILSAYHQKVDDRQEYTIEDHPFLHKGSPMYGDSVRAIFEEFRRNLLALDACVVEEFLKLYVAYKAETNFVDVIPQAKRLVLTLNMKFVDIVDPKGICRDVKDLGRWGNGEVEVFLSSADEIPYVLGLARQALDRQLGDSGSS